MGLKKIILVGYMASGKSAVGRKLHEQLNYDYYDLDNYIEIKYGTSVENIFKTKGELYFRQIERKSLENIITIKKNLIVSLGGGTPCYFDTIDFLNSINETKTFFLKATINTIHERLKKSKIKRPLISHLIEEMEIKEFIGKHLLERNFFYEKSEKKIYTDKKTVNAVANEIIKTLG
tara:strand:+ start:125 stop:655 length:531 start_codon:yes stop_codon:yes gene_type:complete